MKHSLKIGFLAILFTGHSMAFDLKDIETISLDRPIWTLGLENAAWLTPKKIENPTSIAVLSFSAEMKGIPEGGQEEKEDDLGRTTRALPLYLSERINLETQCLAINYIPVLKKIGPVVSGVRTDGPSLASAFKEKHKYIVTGHFEKDNLNLSNKLSIYLYDVSSAKELPLVEITKLWKSETDIAAIVADEFFIKLNDAGICTFLPPPEQFPRPPKQYTREYMVGLGQLFMQTLVQNEYLPKEALWGEDNMLNWYVSLGKVMPGAATPELMHIRGVLASFEYGTDAYKSHFSALSVHLASLSDLNDPVNRISPIFFYKFGEWKTFQSKKRLLGNIKDERYQKWLKKFSNMKKK